MLAPWYAAMFVNLERVAWRHGYALAVHGSLARDMDLIAVPWTADAEDAAVLVEAVRQFVVGEGDVDLRIGEATLKPHGRLAYVIPIGYGRQYLDLSIMPRVGAAGAGEQSKGERNGKD